MDEGTQTIFKVSGEAFPNGGVKAKPALIQGLLRDSCRDVRGGAGCRQPMGSAPCCG